MSKRTRLSAPRMSDIARLAGVDVSTVSRALTGSSLVKEQTRENILKLADSCGYVVNTAARSLRLMRTQTISVVIPLAHETGQSLTDPFFIEMLGHLAEAITQRGYGLFLQKIPHPGKDWLNDLIASHRCDGIIVIGQSTEHGAIESAAAHYQPLVVWGGQLDHQSYCTVGSDNVSGTRRAVEHLLELGRRRIVFLGDTTIPEIQLRYQGFQAALHSAPRGASAHRVVAHLTADAAYEAMRACITTQLQFDAVVGATDVIAMSAIRAITAAGLQVPTDIAVVGYDDIAFAAHTNPPLTTVRQNLQHGARTLVELLFRRMRGETTASVTLAPELIVRESCGAGLATSRRSQMR